MKNSEVLINDFEEAIKQLQNLPVHPRGFLYKMEVSKKVWKQMQEELEIEDADQTIGMLGTIEVVVKPYIKSVKFYRKLY